MTTLFLDFFKFFLQILVRLSDLLFSFNVYGTLSIGDLMVAIFISRIAFSILIKGANVGIDTMRSAREVSSVSRKSYISIRNDELHKQHYGY